MTTRRHLLLSSALLPAALPALAQSALAQSALAQSALAQPALSQTNTTEAGPLRITNAWTRAAGQGMQGGGFLTIRNTSATADKLLSATSPAAGRLELHTHIRDGDVMRMRPVADIPVPANGEVMLQPGGLHLMLIGLTQAMNAGQSVPVTLRFEQAGEVTVQFAVQAAGARQPAHRH